MCVRRTIGIRYVSKKRTNGMTTTTRLAEEFKGSPRLAAIESVFKLIETDAPTSEVWAKASRVMHNLNRRRALQATRSGQTSTIKGRDRPGRF
jgi:hypothetical protein